MYIPTYIIHTYIHLTHILPVVGGKAFSFSLRLQVYSYHGNKKICTCNIGKINWAKRRLVREGR